MAIRVPMDGLGIGVRRRPRQVFDDTAILERFFMVQHPLVVNGRSAGIPLAHAFALSVILVCLLVVRGFAALPVRLAGFLDVVV